MDKSFYDSVRQELTGDILPYWEKYARDTSTGGFWSVISNDNVPSDVPGGRTIVMAARYLWAYSAAARLLHDAKYLDMADYAFSVINRDYYDKECGGFFWSVNPDGSPCVEKKQIYGDAFAIYGISEYAAAVVELRANRAETQARSDIIMGRALETFTMLEHYARDFSCGNQAANANNGRRDGGYIEAVARDWTATADLKLSEKDIDCAKSMNTNLHVMEAYTNLYRTLAVVHRLTARILSKEAQSRAAKVRQDEDALRALVGDALRDLIEAMTAHIVMADGHLGVYFNMDWSRIDNEVSYGHDIEASWLLWEAASELGDAAVLEKVRPVSLRIAETALREGYDAATGGFDNKMLEGVGDAPQHGKRDTTRVWWNQAEAINGFYNAYKMTGQAEYADSCLHVWQWIMERQRDVKHGEWYQEVSKEGVPDLSHEKGGNWKTAYHNARCCIEVLRRVAAKEGCL